MKFVIKDNKDKQSLINYLKELGNDYIVDDFDLTPWTAQAVQYILRAGKKEGNSTAQDIRKAINVLHFELDKLHEEDKTKTGGLAK